MANDSGKLANDTLDVKGGKEAQNLPAPVMSHDAKPPRNACAEPVHKSGDNDQQSPTSIASGATNGPARSDYRCLGDQRAVPSYSFEVRDR